MYSVYPNQEGSLEFLALELVPLRQAIQRINQINGGRDNTQSVLRVLDGTDELEEAEGDGPKNHALTRLARHHAQPLQSRRGERTTPHRVEPTVRAGPRGAITGVTFLVGEGVYVH